MTHSIIWITGVTFDAGTRFEVIRRFQTSGGERWALGRDGEIYIPQVRPDQVETLDTADETK